MSLIPNQEHLVFFRQTHFVRNAPIDDFVNRVSKKIILADYMCYNVGYINDKKFIQSFQILKAHITGIQNYYIRWWNTAFSYSEEDASLDYTEFWVHSGSALRKNFFLFEDRFSLFRSTFLFDPISETFFRLFTIEQYLVLNESLPNGKIYHSPSRYNFRQKKEKSTNRKKNSHKNVQKQLQLFLKHFISCNSLEKNYAPLFREIHLILQSDGKST